ncbi:MAG: hypothetical protein K2O18_07220 [Oscillospiraceae bacterium]|nr:hypothetical protein [Oscillospiraceae bacterium]
MTELIREWFEYKAKKNWLKCIGKAADKYNRLNQRARVQAHVHKLMERYNEIYGEEIGLTPKEKQRDNFYSK